MPEGEEIAKIGYQAYDDFKTRFNEENHLSPISIKFAMDAYHEEVDKKIISFGFSQSAYPQHSMKNLLNALMNPENNAVANRFY